MADNPKISQIKLPNGSTYDIEDNTSGYTSNTGTITDVKTTEGAHTTINVSSGVAEFNVPTKTSHLTNDSGYLTASDIASVLTYKGTKASVANLPSTGNTTGDVWHITADGSEYAWDGSIWQELGTAIDLSGYAQLSGASFTGPVTFGDSVTADELNTGDLVVTGAASFTNNIQANTINGVEVGNSPKFTDTVTTVSVTGSGNAVTAASASNGVVTLTKGATFLTSYTETDPVFGASAAASITSTDISNWNAKVSDDKTWNNKSLSISTTTGNDFYVPRFNSTSASTAYLILFTATPTASCGVRYDSNAYLYSTTPSANDNSTKVATTAYVDNAIPKVYSSTNTGGYLTMATLPIYDGTVE